MPSDSPKALFNKWKARTSGMQLAGFLLEQGGEVEVLRPADMRVMTPLKLKMKLKKKGVAGSFEKGDSGMVFKIMAGKAGGSAAQPWVKQALRKDLGVSTITVEEAPGAEVDPDPSTLVAPPLSAPTKESSGLDLGGLDSLEEMVPEIQIESDPISISLDLLEDELEEDPVSSLGEGLDLLDVPTEDHAQSFETHRKQAAALLETLDKTAKRLVALKDPSAANHTGAHTDATKRLSTLVELAKTEASTADESLAGLLLTIKGADTAASKAAATRVETLKKAATEAVKALKADGRVGWIGDLLSTIEGELSTANSSVDSDPATAAQLWLALPAKCATAIDNNVDYKKYRKERETQLKRLDALEDEFHKAHIATDIATIETRVHEAHLKAEGGNKSDANDKLAAAKGALDTAADRIQKYTAYRVLRAKSFQAAQLLDQNLSTPRFVSKIEVADVLAKVPNRLYPQATARLNNIVPDAKSILTTWAVTNMATPKAAVRTGPCQDFVDEEIQEIGRLEAALPGLIAGEKWVQAVLQWRKLQSTCTAATRLAKRRKRYEDKQTVAENARKEVAKSAHLQGQAVALAKLITKADEWASRKVMRIEQGMERLDSIIETCGQLTQVSKDAKTFWSLLKETETRLGLLQKHTRKDHIESNLDAADGHLNESHRLAGIIGWKKREGDIAPIGVDNETQDFPAAIGAVKRAQDELDTATALLSASKGADTLLTGAKGISQEESSAQDVRDLVKSLRERDALLNSHEHKKLVTFERTHISDSLDEALHQVDELGEDGIDLAAVPLKGAAEFLVQAEVRLAEHTHSVAIHKAENDRVLALESKPTAAKNASKIDLAKPVLAKAAEQALAGDYAKAATIVRTAAGLLDEAELWHKERTTFEARRGAAGTSATGLWAKVGAITDTSTGGRKETATTHMNKADTAADRFQFEEARKQLDLADSQVQLETMMKSGDYNTILNAGKAALKLDGGTDAVDKLIADRMGDSEVYARLLKDLAKERFDLELTSDVLSPTNTGGRMEALQRMWKMMSKCPDLDVRLNPSLLVVRREEPGSEGGYYSSSKDLVVMNGRPSTSSSQRFGSAITVERDVDGNITKDARLPEVDERCKPANEDPIKYFDWATLHEVGHAVDDRLGFMTANGQDDSYGAWIQYTSNLDAVAAAIAAKASKTKSADFLPYAKALVGKADVERVVMPETFEQHEWDQARKTAKAFYATATNENIWWSQKESEACTSDGRVYQEAYKGKWVSYAVDARKKGISGYQFRAPGEWFAELYAAFHSDKLKKGHPSRKWLAAL